jgi:hypothetical protein
LICCRVICSNIGFPDDKLIPYKNTYKTLAPSSKAPKRKKLYQRFTLATEMPEFPERTGC